MIISIENEITPWKKNYWYSGLFIIFGIGIILLGQYISQYNGIKYEYQKPPLYDAIHSNFPDVSKYYWINSLLVIIVALRLLFFRHYNHVHDCIITIIYAMIARAINISFVSIPSCIPTCFDSPGSFPFNTCFDFMFSGHTVTITIIIMFICAKLNKYYEKIFWILYLFFAALFIICSKQHYSSDVFLAILFGIFLSLFILNKKAKITL